MEPAEIERAVQDAIRQHSELYNAIKAAYEHEQHDGNPTDADRHIFGVIAAVNAVYVLGLSTGYTQGYKAAAAEAERARG